MSILIPPVPKKRIDKKEIQNLSYMSQLSHRYFYWHPAVDVTFETESKIKCCHILIIWLSWIKYCFILQNYNSSSFAIKTFTRASLTILCSPCAPPHLGPKLSFWPLIWSQFEHPLEWGVSPSLFFPCTESPAFVPDPCVVAFIYQSFYRLVVQCMHRRDLLMKYFGRNIFVKKCCKAGICLWLQRVRVQLPSTTFELMLVEIAFLKVAVLIFN